MESKDDDSAYFAMPECPILSKSLSKRENGSGNNYNDNLIDENKIVSSNNTIIMESKDDESETFAMPTNPVMSKPLSIKDNKSENKDNESTNANKIVPPNNTIEIKSKDDESASFAIPRNPVLSKQLSKKKNMSENIDNESLTDEIEIVSSSSTTKMEAKDDYSASFAIPTLPILSKQLSKKENNSSIEEQSLSNEKSVSISNTDRNGNRRISRSAPIPYKEPPWSGLPPCSYNLQVLKGGAFLEKITLENPYTLVGRSDACQVKMEHPSLSRYHCIIQYRFKKGETTDEDVGMYIYDLGSTHGTYLNKYRVIPRKYVRMKVGHMAKFGGSTRLFILEGPCEDQEAESDLSITELKKIATERKLKELKQDARNDVEDSVTLHKEDGINWGMAEDAEEQKESSEESDEDRCVNPFTLPDDLDLPDPKKTLRGWFEREGYDIPNYIVEDISSGFFRVKLQLPLPNDSISCSIDHKGKKKDAVIQCALEACRLLDKKKLLRQAKHISHARKKSNYQENDFYSSEEDEYFDRTGDVQQKRKKRIGESESKNYPKEFALTYKALISDYEKVIADLDRLEDLLKANDPKLKDETKSDEIDTYMMELKSNLPDKQKRRQWKLECVKLQKEEVRLRELVNLARPIGTDELQPRDGTLFIPKKNVLPVKIGKGSSRILLADVPKTKVLTKQTTGVHKLFLEEEVEYKQKLTKLDSNDDLVGVKPVPYYEKKLKARDRVESVKRQKSIPSCIKKEISHSAEEELRKEKLCNNKREELINKNLRLERLNEFSNEDSDDVCMISGSLEFQKTGAEVDNATNFENEDVKKEKASIITPSLLKKHKDKISKKRKMYDEVETWIPPLNQTGDGKTHLNEKFGY